MQVEGLQRETPTSRPSWGQPERRPSQVHPERPLSRTVQQQAYVGLSDEEAAVLPGVKTGADVVAFYATFGASSAVRYFHCNRHCSTSSWH